MTNIASAILGVVYIFAVLLGSDNLYTTPLEITFLIRSPLWWRYMVGGPLSLASMLPLFGLKLPLFQLLYCLIFTPAQPAISNHGV